MVERNKDKVMIITGAASGLGEAVALQLANEGAKLSLVDLNEKALSEVEEKITSEAPNAEILTITANVADESQVKNYVQETVDKFGRIDGFFNNAGVEGKQNTTEDYTSEEFSKVLSVNLEGVFYGLTHVLKVMKEQGSGAIVNSASVGGIRGVGNQSGYAASKHGVVGLTKNSAIEYGTHGIHVNAIAPGAIMTTMVEASLKQMDSENWEEAGEDFVQNNPMQRFGDPKEVGYLVSFLLSDESKFINAQTIAIDGGQSQKY